MLNIWGRNNSINVQKVMWTVGELGLEHHRIDAGGRFGGLDTPEFDALNPNRLVPAIEDDGVVVWESNTIVRYLAARYGADSLWPADPARRAQADKWMDWMITSLLPDMTVVFWGLVLLCRGFDLGRVASASMAKLWARETPCDHGRNTACLA